MLVNLGDFTVPLRDEDGLMFDNDCAEMIGNNGCVGMTRGGVMGNSERT